MCDLNSSSHWRPPSPTREQTTAARRHLTTTPAINHASEPAPLPSPSPHGAPPPSSFFFTPEDRAYLRGRLPIHQPASARTAAQHFARLPRVYQALADGCRAHLVLLAAAPGDGCCCCCCRCCRRRARVAVLAQRLADRYRRFRLVLPPSYIDEAVARWRRRGLRASRFWDGLLDEVERANTAWSILRLFILASVVQSTLVACAFALLTAAPARLALLAASALACVWSATVAGERLHACCVAADDDEQELHDLLGGLRA
ncbi:hypothetical protein HRG_010981 [Hirsutella rhossiliensis]|uniref:Uncharacterized protein n=1 Tax=Hirsutella rhossiliensis TaxID=111463 RepID=A0A9P8SCQ6_9HYPO|nr:uncharacterized protein HRG_10981 [Hirsutella rhossiliensis]KAH0957888.1 hypothetical protein HRG_10981 [Hirsutella rhossiliensis]